MAFRRARGAMGRQYQRAAIARAYAQAWRPADPAELAEFLRQVAECATAPVGTGVPHEIEVSARSRRVSLAVGRREYRVIVRRGADVLGVIRRADVERFEWRQI